MSSVLLISRKNSLAEPLTAALPEQTLLIHLTTIAEAQVYLGSWTGSGECAPELIVLDVGEELEIASGCGQLRQLTKDIPIIAVISQPADRQAALDAGVDDYIFQPLLQSEVKNRLFSYLHPAARSLDTLIETIRQMSMSDLPEQTLSQGVKNLAEAFSAQSAWLYLLESGEETPRLAGSYNLPPLIMRQGNSVLREVKAHLKNIRQSRPNKLPLISCSCLANASPQDSAGLTHHLGIAFNNSQGVIGLLNLAYDKPPWFSRADHRLLAMLSWGIGIMVEIFLQQEEIQLDAAQGAFITLIARMINKRLDMSAILSLTLDQAVGLLNTSGGDIWLISNDGQWLELTSSLTSPFFDRKLSRRPRGQGLIGWVADYGRPLWVESPTDDPRFNPQVDQQEGTENYPLLAVPLRHYETTIGVLAVYNKKGVPFGRQDAILLESIAGLTSSAIANARLVKELRDYAAQQRVLNEMSQQIANGLELQATIDRALDWVDRLFDVEYSLLWLADKTNDNLNLVATLGIELPEQTPTVPIGKGLAGWVALNNEMVVLNDPADDPSFELHPGEILNSTPRNIVAAPITYRSQVIGVLSLVNRIEGSFNTTDLTLLSTAIKMIAMAVGNASLHTQTLALVEERERLYKQLLQSERLSTIGRLTASLSHEINNPMQAIRGALVLATEELRNPQELANYISLSLKESDRVVQLLNRLRQVYRPQKDAPETLDLNHLLREVVETADKELKRQKVILHADLSSEIPPINAIANQLHLVFLSHILNLSDAIGSAGGGELQIRSLALPQAVRVELEADLPDETAAVWTRVLKLGTSQEDTDIGLGSSLSYDIVAAHGGYISLNRQGRQTIFSIELPTSAGRELGR